MLKFNHEYENLIKIRNNNQSIATKNLVTHLLSFDIVFNKNI